ncbi:MAG: hypothetical protein IPH04_10795 [Saprospirales bacterium]|nr:hypothetical protein [Saprospirales bacterium]
MIRHRRRVSPIATGVSATAATTSKTVISTAATISTLLYAKTNFISTCSSIQEAQPIRVGRAIKLAISTESSAAAASPAAGICSTAST